ASVAAPAAAPVAAPTPAPAAPAAPAVANDTAATTGGNRFYSPLVLNIAAKEGISMSELERIPGTGSEGRVTKKDILNYVANRGAAAAVPAAPAAPAPAAAASQASAPAVNYSGANVEIVEMDRMRKLIADHMVRSKATSPH